MSCRLKDIKDLFFDTGMGSHAYSVIERSMVDNLLSDNTGHRRFLFEEASGITKYKARKKEALNKLEATQTDLVRVSDLLVEIEKEIGSLARQVAKARRHERYRSEIQDLDLRLSALKHHGLIAREKELAEEHQAESVRREGAQTELDTREAALQSVKIEQIEEERTLAAAQQTLAEREAERAAAQHEALVLAEREDGLTRRIAQLDEEIGRATERLAELAAREADVKAQVEELEAAEVTRRDELHARETELAAIEAELKETRAEVTGVKQLALNLFQVESKERAEVERARERLTNLAERREAVEAALKALAERLETTGAELAAAEETATRAQAALAEAEARTAQLAARGQEIELEGTARVDAETDARARHAGVASRLATLEELKRAYEGVDEAVKSFLSGRGDGAIGLVADLLTVPAERLDAVEAGLGPALSAVVLPGADDLVRARHELAAAGGGRVGFLALEHAEETARAWSHALAGRGDEARAAYPDAIELAGVVGAREGAAPLVQALLAGVFALDDEERAAEAARRYPEFTWVSSRGTVFARGLVTAGRAQDADRGLLRREHEITALVAERDVLDQAVAAAVEARARWTAEREGWQAETREHASLIARLRDEAQAGRGRVEALTRERAQAERERESRLAESLSVSHDEAQVTELLVTLEAALEESTSRSREKSGEAATLESRLAELEARREASARAANEARTAWIDGTSRLGSLRQDLARCEVTARETAETRGRREIERAAANDRRIETSDSRVRAESSLSGLVDLEAEARRAAEEARARTLGKRRAGAGRGGGAARAASRGERAGRARPHARGEPPQRPLRAGPHARAPARRVRRRPHDLRARAVGRGGARRALRSRDRDRAARGAAREVPRPRPGEPAGARGVHQEEGAPRVPRPSSAATCSGQGQLLEAIEKINTTASQLFLETFTKVQTHFTRHLQDAVRRRRRPSCAWSARIRSSARSRSSPSPRGKNLQHISLLSSRRARADRDRAAVRDLPGQAVAVLPARRGRRAARRRQRRSLPAHAAGASARRRSSSSSPTTRRPWSRPAPVRRHHAGAGRLQAGVGPLRHARVAPAGRGRSRRGRDRGVRAGRRARPAAEPVGTPADAPVGAGTGDTA